VIEVDAGDNGHIPIEYVHRIEPSAESDFEDGDVNAGIDEPGHGSQRTEFEIGQRGIATRRPDFFERRDQFGIAGLLSGNPYPLVVAQQMRRSIEAGFVTGGQKNGFQIGTGRTLAIGTRDDNERERRGKSECRPDLAHPIKPQCNSIGMHLLQPRQPIGQRAGRAG